MNGTVSKKKIQREESKKWRLRLKKLNRFELESLAATKKGFVTALEKSIIHWKQNVDGETNTLGADHCALCKFAEQTQEKKSPNEFAPYCSYGCPIENVMNMDGCKGTPWTNLYWHNISHEGIMTHTFVKDCPECKRLVREEFKFLSNLLALIKKLKEEDIFKENVRRGHGESQYAHTGGIGGYSEGSQGFQGTQGNQGCQGFQGTPGAQGNQGATGSQGKYFFEFGFNKEAKV